MTKLEYELCRCSKTLFLDFLTVTPPLEKFNAKMHIFKAVFLKL